MSKGGGKTTTVQKSDPWSGVQPHLSNLFGAAQNQFNQGPYNYQANQSPLTRQAQGLLVDRARDPNSIIGQTQGVLGDTISGQYLSPDSNPHLRASVEDALGMAKSAFAGQYGGQAGSNLGNSGYQEALARGLGATATNAYANHYGQERANQLNAMSLAPTLGNMDAAQLAGVGAQQEALNQQQFNSPWQNIGQYQQAISGQGGGTTSTDQPYYENKAASALGGGLAGYGLMSSLGSMAMLPTAAPMFGAGAGALLGLLSDERAKENIERVGKLDESGLGVYRYNYKGDPTPQIGVLAQEVEKVKPEAVSEVDGVKFVHYKMI